MLHWNAQLRVCGPHLALQKKAPLSQWRDDLIGLLAPGNYDLADGLVNALEQICVLIPSECKSDTTGRAIFNHEHLITRGAKGSFAVPTFNTVSILGHGVLADIITDVLNDISIKQVGVGGDFNIIVADRPDFPALRKVYSDAGKAPFKSCIWFDDGGLRLGPLHVQDESACLECFISRSEAAAHFFEEAFAFNNQPYLSVNEKPLGRMERNLASFAIERYLILIQQGQFNQVEPGMLETWMLLSGEKDVRSVLRNPYCTCVSASFKPRRAARDIV